MGNSPMRKWLRQLFDCEEPARPAPRRPRLPSYPPDGSLRECVRARWVGCRHPQFGVVRLQFELEDSDAPLNLLVSEDELRRVASQLCLYSGRDEYGL